MALAVVFWSVVNVLTGFANSVFAFASFRFLLGVGEGFNWPAASKTVAEWFPSEERSHGDDAAEKLRQRFPHACIVAVFLPGMLLQADEEGAGETMKDADKSASSLGHAVQICLDMQSKPLEQ